MIPRKTIITIIYVYEELLRINRRMTKQFYFSKLNFYAMRKQGEESAYFNQGVCKNKQ